LNLSLASIAIFLVWQVSIIINDIYDVSIDKWTNKNRPLVTGVIKVSEYKQTAIIFSFLSLSFAIVVNFKIFILVLIALFFAIIYSRPPVRLRKNLAGNILIGASLLLSFFIGVYSSGKTQLMTAQVILLSFLIFLFGVIATLAKDIKDIQGDRKDDIKNLFTIYSKRKGKIFVTLLIFITFTIPAIVFKLISIFILSLLVCFFYYNYENVKVVYAGAGFIILFSTFTMYSSIILSLKINYSLG